jgi:Fringe-like
MRTLIGVMSCHANPQSLIMPMPVRTLVDHTKRLPYIRQTWASEIEDYKIFFGRGGHASTHPDEVLLDCGDSYYETAFKVREMCRYALANGYDSLFKVDDDTYLVPERLQTAGYEAHDFVCRVLPATDENHPCPYPYGGCGYYLGKKMLELAAKDEGPATDPDGDTWGRCNTYEDGWIGRVAKDAGIALIDDHRLKALRHGGDFEGHPWQAESPMKSNDCIAVCEFPEEYMLKVHEHWKNSCATV